MKLTVLLDNNTYIGEYYLGEPGLCYYIEEDGLTMLLDTGYSDVALRNAPKLGCDLGKVQKIALSHGHNDHTGGLAYMAKTMDISGVEVLAHPDAFLPKRNDNGKMFGSPMSEDELDKVTRLSFSTEPVWLTDKLVWLGEIPRVHAWEKNLSLGEATDSEDSDEWHKDSLPDDTALALKTPKGVFVITGCSHSGICNIITRALEVCGDRRLYGVMGGMHLTSLDERSEKSIAFMESLHPEVLYPAHCTCFEVRAEMVKRGLPVGVVAVGMKLEIL